MKERCQLCGNLHDVENCHGACIDFRCERCMGEHGPNHRVRAMLRDKEKGEKK